MQRAEMFQCQNHRDLAVLVGCVHLFRVLSSDFRPVEMPRVEPELDVAAQVVLATQVVGQREQRDRAVFLEQVRAVRVGLDDDIVVRFG